MGAFQGISANGTSSPPSRIEQRTDLREAERNGGSDRIRVMFGADGCAWLGGLGGLLGD